MRPPQQPCSVSRVVTVKVTVELKEGDIPLDVCVCKEEEVEGRIEPERRALKSQQPGMGPETPEQLCFSSRERQPNIVDGCLLADGSLN